MIAAKASRLLKAIMNTAADDRLIRRNPCGIKCAAVRLPGAESASMTCGTRAMTLRRDGLPGHLAREWHATTGQVVKIASRGQEPGSDLRRGMCALGATRTRDLLLRRQLLYPLSYQG